MQMKRARLFKRRLCLGIRIDIYAKCVSCSVLVGHTLQQQQSHWSSSRSSQGQGSQQRFTSVVFSTSILELCTAGLSQLASWAFRW